MDPIEAPLEEIEIERKNVPKYIPVGAHSEQVIEMERISEKHTGRIMSIFTIRLN